MSDIPYLLKRVFEADMPEREDLVCLLSLKEAVDVACLFHFADEVRRRFMGDGIYLRGLVEFSNYCRNSCLYCGLNNQQKDLQRYRLSEEEIIESAALVASCGIKTIVLQSGEDDILDAWQLACVIRKIKRRHDMAVTLCIGEKSLEEYRLFKDSGADRYLLKMEITNRALYNNLHPGMCYNNRIRCLRQLKKLGYQTGSGSIIGLPRQTLEMIADDVLFFKRECFSMISMGPLVACRQASLAGADIGNAGLTLNVLAVARIVLKNVYMPAVTALASLGDDYRPQGLCAGANVMMPNFTPMAYRRLYEIYSQKKCLRENGELVISDYALLARQAKSELDFAKN